MGRRTALPFSHTPKALVGSPNDSNHGVKSTGSWQPLTCQWSAQHWLLRQTTTPPSADHYPGPTDAVLSVLTELPLSQKSATVYRKIEQKWQNRHKEDSQSLHQRNYPLWKSKKAWVVFLWRIRKPRESWRLCVFAIAKADCELQ